MIEYLNKQLDESKRSYPLQSRQNYSSTISSQMQPRLNATTMGYNYQDSSQYSKNFTGQLTYSQNLTKSPITKSYNYMQDLGAPADIKQPNLKENNESSNYLAGNNNDLTKYLSMPKN